ncbi:MAG: hypothetical protein J6A19_05960 [Oscillospiraceae bacterium]|nr:hypothetical protein [Oscillospiraceae bacterium]
MRRSLSISAMMIAAALLSGCTAANESKPSDSSDTASDVSSVTQESTEDSSVDSADSSSEADSSDLSEPESSEESSESETEEDELSFDLIGLLGEKIKPSDISMIAGVSGEDMTPDQLTEDNWYYLTCGNFAYAGKSTGICYNSIDNADMFDSDTLSFKGVPKSAPTEYEIIRPGDEICGFTVKSASTNFNSQGTYSDCTYFTGCTAEFEGSAELTGYVWIAPEDDYGVFTGAIYFVPAPGSDILPVINFNGIDIETNRVDNKLFVGGLDNFYWVNEYPNILLGNTSEISVDVSGIPVDNQYHKAKITIDGFSVTSDIDWVSSVRCSLTGLEAL